MMRDILIGTIAGALALIVIKVTSTKSPPPAGILQAALNEPNYRAMEQAMAATAMSTSQTQGRLESRIEKLEIHRERLDWVLQYLADTAGVDIQVEWRFVRDYVAPDRKVSLALYDVTVGRALAELLREIGPDAQGIVIQIRPGQVLLTLGERVNKEQVTCVYDVRDLLELALEPGAAFKRRKGPPATLPASVDQQVSPYPRSTSWLDWVTTQQEACYALVDGVEKNVDAASWRDHGGGDGWIRLIAGRLVVTQTRANQDQVAIYLDWLREAMR